LLSGCSGFLDAICDIFCQNIPKFQDHIKTNSFFDKYDHIKQILILDYINSMFNQQKTTTYL
jgi:hypothetical protein